MKAIADLKVKTKGSILALVPTCFVAGIVALFFCFVLWSESDLRQIEHFQQGMYQLQSFTADLASRFVQTVAPGSNVQSPIGSDDRSDINPTVDLNGEHYPELATAIRDANSLLSDFYAMLKERNQSQTIDNFQMRFLDWLSEANRFSESIQAQHISLFERQVEELRQLNRLLWMLSLLCLPAVVTCTTIVLVFFNRDLTSRLRTMRANAEGLAIPGVILSEVDGTDEVARANQHLLEANSKLNDIVQIESLVFDVAKEAFCALDKNFKITVCGKSLQVIFKAPAEPLLGQSILVFFGEEERQFLRIALLNAKAKDYSQFTLPLYDHVSKSENYFHWQVSWQAEVKQFNCVIRDVSTAVHLERARETFLSAVNHDLRAPLSSLFVGLALAREHGKGQISASAEKSLLKIEQELNTLRHTVDNFLLLSKLDSGKMNIDAQAINLFDFFHLFLEKNLTARSPGLDVVFDSEIFFLADPSLLSKTILLLVEKIRAAGIALHSLKILDVRQDLQFVFVLEKVTDQAFYDKILAFDEVEDLLIQSLLKTQKMLTSRLPYYTQDAFAVVLPAALLDVE